MPTYPLKQPNGLYAIFSTIVDDFTDMNLTRDGAFSEMNRRGGEDAAARLLRRADADDEASAWDKDAPVGLRRWHGALDTVVNVHDEETAAARRSVGEVPPPVPAQADPEKRTGKRVTLGYVVKQCAPACGSVDLYAAILFGDDGEPFIAWGPRRRAARLSRYDARYMARANNYLRRKMDCGQRAVVVRLVRVVP